MTEPGTAAEFTRTQLFDLLWTEPASRIAPRLGISDVGLAKVCRKYHIPRPWRGFWREKETGRNPRPSKLPPWPKHLGSEPEAITFRSAPPMGETPQRPPEPESVRAQQAYEALADHRLSVASSLADPHPMVRRAGRLLKRVRDRNLLGPNEWPCLDVQATRDSLDRALLVFDAILKALRARGWTAVTQSEQPYHTQVTVLEETIAICIVEKVRRVENPKPPTKPGVYTFTHFERYRYEPTGQLSIRLAGGSSFAYEAYSWNDGKVRRLESCLNDVMVGFVRVAEQKKEARREQERRHREWVEEERLRMAAVERQARESDRREELKRQVEAWRQSEEIRAYLAALKSASEAQVTADPDGRLARWIRWVEGYATSSNPLGSVEKLPRDPQGYGRTPLALEAFATQSRSD